MKTTLAVYFGIDRTYAAIFCQNAQGIEVLHIGIFPQILQKPEDIQAIASLLKKEFAPFSSMIQECHFSIPIEKVFIYQLPPTAIENTEEIKAMLAHEIRQSLPDAVLSDFDIYIIPGSTPSVPAPYLLAILTEQAYVHMCKQALSIFNAPIKYAQNSQFAAHSAFAYNYPEYAEKTAVIFGVQEKFMDVSVIHNNQLAFYSLFGIPSQENFGSIAIKVMTSILPQYIPTPDIALLYSNGLEKQLMDILAEGVTVPVSRLNAFRNIIPAPTLTVSAITLCGKTAHLFPAVLGAILPPLQEKDCIRL